MNRRFAVGLISVGVVFLILVIVFWTDSAHWFLRYTGADAEPGTWYGFWSGFGGSIPDFLILGSIITIYRHLVSRQRMPATRQAGGRYALSCLARRIIPLMTATSVPVSEEIIKLAHKAHLEHEASWIAARIEKLIVAMLAPSAF